LEVTRASKAELEEEYRRGVEDGLKEQKFGPLLSELPAFAPWTSGARFEHMRSWFDGFVAFERGVTENLRDVERARWMLERRRAELVNEIDTAVLDRARSTRSRYGFAVLRRLRWRPLRIAIARMTVFAYGLQTELGDCERELATAERVQRFIREQLHLVREAVDAELAFGHGYACTVEAIRSSPTRPLGVHEFVTVETFVHGDRRRVLWGADGRMGAGGEDYGFSWRLENPLRRWLTTRWRVSWLSIADGDGETPTYEVYAIEFCGAGSSEETGRVWLLGKIRSRGTISAILPELEEHAQGERNSLVVVAEAIQTASRAERLGADPS
jgi:hypothetical protein